MKYDREDSEGFGEGRAIEELVMVLRLGRIRLGGRIMELGQDQVQLARITGMASGGWESGGEEGLGL